MITPVARNAYASVASVCSAVVYCDVVVYWLFLGSRRGSEGIQEKEEKEGVWTGWRQRLKDNCEIIGIYTSTVKYTFLWLRRSLAVSTIARSAGMTRVRCVLSMDVFVFTWC